MQQALAILHIGEEELREVELENRLADRGRHPTERAVLEVLATAERPLRQAEVHERLNLPKKGLPTPSRVGQILRELYDHGFARRQLARARGYSEVSHYLLAPRGVELCRQLGISTTRSRENQERRALTATSGAPPQVKARKVLETVLDARVEPKIRRVAAGSIANSSRAGLRNLFPELLSTELAQQTDELGRMLLWVIQVTQTLDGTKDLLEKMKSGRKQSPRREEIQEAIENIDHTSAFLLAA
ncbi:MAG: hypothetical protein HC897_05425 [Thermoanaerobaculia bacterium]|nr:hypothetical protein [Thermoanaerobaculia bacterium]